MPPRRPAHGHGLRTRRRVVTAMLVCAPLIAGCVSAGQSASSPQSSPASASSHTATAPTVAHPDPTFSYPGNPQCAITYGSRGSGSMYWTANVTVAGSLRTHASDTAGDLYSHVASVAPGPNGFVAPQPLWKIDDIGGVLYAADGKSYACSIAPAR